MTRGEGGKGDEDDNIKNYSSSSFFCSATKTWEEKSIQEKNKSSSTTCMKEL